MEFEAEGFKTLPETTAWAQANTFDLLISDNHISSDVHAGDVLKALTEIKGKTFKSFVLTNHVDPQTIASIKQAGFDDIIEKPITVEKLKKVAGL